MGGAASVWYNGGLRHPHHHLQRLLGHRRHHLPVPRAKESEQRGRPSYAHPDCGMLLDILAVLLHGADEPPDRPRAAAEGPLRHSDLLGESNLENLIKTVSINFNGRPG